MPPRPVILCILDGWGLGQAVASNAVSAGKTPVFDRLMAECPNGTLAAHGNDVGLPEGQMGNSEVGHTNIGAGRIVWMDLPKIDRAIAEGSFANNPALTGFIDRLKESGGTAHLAGLASPGGVHAHQRHIAEAARVIAGAGVPVVIHAFTDGRDVPPKSALGQLSDLEAALPDAARIGTVTGRFYAMDRDNRWDRVSQAFDVIAHAKGAAAASVAEAVQAGYDDGQTDEFTPPSVIGDYAGMADGDGLMFLNFRADRAREILAAFLDPAFDGFERQAPTIAAALGVVEYSDQHNDWMEVMFPSEDIPNTLGQWVSAQGRRQFRIAETEKYPHVTFFLNGGVETPYPGEERLMPKSPNVRTYDLKPEMSAAEVTAGVIGAIKDGYDLIVVNYANPDMVGHTGDIEAAKAACEAVDASVGQVLDALKEAGGAMILTADHGNCEVMVDPDTGAPHTAHTLNPVPVILIGGPEGAVMGSGRLADLAPSLLDLMELPQPAEMSGRSLIERG
ncbi:2,3-bisphosphoglycerate-independent phosphoglycerate mutase [Rubricella aquisinus]|uniref:2,3-bisphosphoglycerate-independent phosphoglycerate mutase n=1 Tax=Rubricella aquisinus TaxID=2028108 RepID=A0A840X4R6_9RHOB|nr:2,3-bisphosphoglycerate-independent phosphoglycerate mutase [Rubricella aquisinus]MBB5516796.1 2,3-bisphosphoglycerate-independent phosphoglycerate mutase [Rubricella aquisinus]